MRIGDYRIFPGDHQEIDLLVGGLPTGTTVNIKAQVFRSVNPGPVALFLAGMHGDEINGIEIVREAIFSGIFDNLIAGSVIAIPVLNIYGFMNFSRYVPDGKDVNRSFRGSARGSLASRVAHMMSEKILPLVDFGVDFHTGGESRFNFPQIRYSRGSKKGRDLAELFNPPVILEKPVIAKTLRAHAKSLDIPIIVYEGGEALRLDGHSISTGVQGIRKLLLSKKMIEGKPFRNFDPDHYSRSIWIRAHQSGIFIWSKGAGRPIEKGDVLGHIYRVDGTEKTAVRSPRSGYLIAHNNIPVVNVGDALFNLSY